MAKSKAVSSSNAGGKRRTWVSSATRYEQGRDVSPRENRPWYDNKDRDERIKKDWPNKGAFNNGKE